MDGHKPTQLSKTARAYLTDEGQAVPAHTLYRYECSCGWKGACWYAGEQRARTYFDHHAEAQAAP